jgi:amino acid transporter
MADGAANACFHTPEEEITMSTDTQSEAAGLQRKIDWTGAFWVASGVPALVLFSIGAIAATVGKAAWVVWAVSIAFGFLQAFTYAEIAGLYPNKSGGASVYGAMAWLRYSKFIAPISVWCNWFAWSPVLSIGSGLAAGYVLLALFPADAAINTWQITLLDLGAVKTGLTMRINATFVLGTAILLTVFGIQHGGILRSAKTQKVLAFAALFPLMLVAVVPLVTGDAVSAQSLSNLLPVNPLAWDKGLAIDGVWDTAGWTLMAGGLFIAAWSTYGFETAVCYTSEFKDPKNDTFKAIFYSGLLCIAVFVLVPLAFQGYFGLGKVITAPVVGADGAITNAVYDGILAPDIYSGIGVAAAMASIIGAGPAITNVLIAMMILALVLAIMTSMAGSSRTLYQASADGWLPRYLSKVNEHGAPTAAMWTDLCFNLVLLLLSDYVFVLAASNVGYIIFNFLNLNAGWIHRMDRSNWERPYKAAGWLLAIGAVLGFVNVFLMGMGANVWGAGTLLTGLVVAALVIPVFLYRHYVEDGGVFPAGTADDLHESADIQNQAGMLPYVALVAGVAVVALGYSLAG